MNNKGFTVLELIVSFTLATIIGTFLLQINMVLKTLVTDTTIKSNIVNSGAIITERIQDDFFTNDARIALKCGENCIRFIFSDYTEKVFKIENGDTFKWGDYTLRLKNQSKFGNVITEVNKNIETSIFDNSILTISIPVTNEILEDEVYDVKIVVPYNSEILYVSDDLNFESNNNEYYLGLNGNKTFILDNESIFSDPGSYVYYGDKTCTMINNVNYEQIKKGTNKKVINTFEGGGICSNLSVEINYEALRVNNNKYVNGNYDVTYDLKINGVPTLTTKRHIIVIAKTNRFRFTGSYQTFTAPISGYYKLETWGASGVLAPNSYGAYASSTVRLLKGDKLYIYVGQSNNSIRGVPNFNTNYPSGITFNGYSGGGATDIRTSTSLSDRILVASGGGSGNKSDVNCGYGQNSAGVNSCITNTITPSSTICGPGGGYNSINSSLFVDCNDIATGGNSYVKDSFTLSGRTLTIVNDVTDFNKKIINGKSQMMNPYTSELESHGNEGDGYAIITYSSDVLE